MNPSTTIPTLAHRPLHWVDEPTIAAMPALILDLGDGQALAAWDDGAAFASLTVGHWNDTEGRFESSPCWTADPKTITEAARACASAELAWLIGHAALTAIARLDPDWRHPSGAEFVTAIESLVPDGDPRTQPLVAALHRLRDLDRDAEWEVGAAATRAAQDAANAWLQTSASTVWVVDHVQGGVLEATVVREVADVTVVRFAPGTRLAGNCDEFAAGDLYGTRDDAIQAAAEGAARRARRATAAA